MLLWLAIIRFFYDNVDYRYHSSNSKLSLKKVKHITFKIILHRMHVSQDYLRFLFSTWHPIPAYLHSKTNTFEKFTQYSIKFLTISFLYYLFFFVTVVSNKQDQFQMRSLVTRQFDNQYRRRERLFVRAYTM